jgi:hypothetical protein
VATDGDFLVAAVSPGSSASSTDRPGAWFQDASAPDKLVPAQPLLKAPMRRRGALGTPLHSGAPDQHAAPITCRWATHRVPVAGDPEVLPIGGDQRRRRSRPPSYCLPSPARLGVLFVASSAENIPSGHLGEKGAERFCQVRPNPSKAPTEVDTCRARTPLPGYRVEI